MQKKTTQFKFALLGLLVAGAWAAGTVSAQGFTHLNGGEKGTLRIEFELNGKELGKPIHRIETMQFNMQADPTTDAGPDSSAEEAGAGARTAARGKADAARDRKLAVLGARLDAIDKKQLSEACDNDPDDAACRDGQAAMQSVIHEIEAANSAGTAELSGNQDRYQTWRAVQGEVGKGCGSIDARLLDPGKPQQTAHLPSSEFASAVETCLQMMIADRKSGEVHVFFKLEVPQPARKERGYYFIEGLDIVPEDAGNKAPLRLKFDPRAPHSSGTLTFRGPRGVTTARWSFDRG